MQGRISTSLKLIYFTFFKNPKSLSNEKLEARLRARVHGIEKQGLDEESTDFASMIIGRKLFHEAKSRKLLSDEEIIWCERVLFGKDTIKEIQKISDKIDENLFEIIKNRRSVRSWQEGKITDNEMKMLVEAAKWAPSSSHRQTWHFLLTRDIEKIKIISKIRGQRFVNKSTNCIIVLINIEAYDDIESEYTPYLDAGAAIQNLLLMAHTIGLGACWVNFGKYEIPNQDDMEKIKDLFNIPKNFKIVSIIPIGRLPSRTFNAPGRKASEDIMHIEEF
ncbi:MAG: nitroreductase family protein [Candidatus Hermodarchaeota archaeon]